MGFDVLPSTKCSITGAWARVGWGQIRLCPDELYHQKFFPSLNVDFLGLAVMLAVKRSACVAPELDLSK